LPFTATTRILHRRWWPPSDAGRRAEFPGGEQFTEALPQLSETVFIVDADPAESARVANALQTTEWTTRRFDDACSFLGALDSSSSGCALVASDLPEAGARALIEGIASRGLPITVVAIDRTHDLAVAVDLMRAGAVDVIERPLTARRLRSAVTRCLRHKD